MRVAHDLTAFTVRLKLDNFENLTGSWSSLVGFCVRDAEIARSNRADPTIIPALHSARTDTSMKNHTTA